MSKGGWKGRYQREGQRWEWLVTFKNTEEY